MTNKLILSWQDIETDSKALSKKISLPIDLIVAITKGGLPIATLLTNKHLKNPPIITLQLKEIKTEEKSNYKAQKVKIISPLNIYPIKGKRILIVDDVVATGATLKKPVNLNKKSGLEVLSYRFAPTLSSPLLPFTTLFGMERGGATTLQRPEKYILIFYI